MNNRGPATLKEGPSAPQHHRRCQGKLSPPQSPALQEVWQRMAGQKIGDHDGEQRKRQHDPYLQPSRHAGQFGIGRVYRRRFEARAPCHRWDMCRAHRVRFADAWGRCIRSCDAGGVGCSGPSRLDTRLSGEHFRMHRAGVLVGSVLGAGGQGGLSRHTWLGQPRTLSRILRNRSTRCVLHAQRMPRPSAATPSCRIPGRSSSDLQLPCSTCNLVRVSSGSEDSPPTSRWPHARGTIVIGFHYSASLIPGEPAFSPAWSKSNDRASPGFPVELVESGKSMRLSLQKAAHANMGGAAYRKSGLPIFFVPVRWGERGAPAGTSRVGVSYALFNDNRPMSRR